MAPTQIYAPDGHIAPEQRRRAWMRRQGPFSWGAIVTACSLGTSTVEDIPCLDDPEGRQSGSHTCNLEA
jgi:hypothetical protein